MSLLNCLVSKALANLNLKGIKRQVIEEAKVFDSHEEADFNHLKRQLVDVFLKYLL